MQTKKVQRRRTRQGLTVVALVLAILLTGTFALQQFAQRAINPMWDYIETNYGGRIHDNFNGVGASTSPHNKDIYAENFGEDDIFVRVRLLEYLMIDGTSIGNASADIDDPMTWSVFTADNDLNRTGTAAPIGTRGIAWNLGHQDAAPKYFMPTFNQVTHSGTPDASVPAPYNHEHTYRMTDATGVGVDWFSATSGSINHASDFAANGTQTAPGTLAAQHATDAGNHNMWTAATESLTSTLLYTYIDAAANVETRTQANVTHYAQRTLQHSTTFGDHGIITIEAWQDAGRPRNQNLWILDVDGWFYWNGYLPAGEATSLLLDSIVVDPTFNNNWEYVITIDGDFFTEETINLMNMSTAALEIFDLNVIDLVCGGNDLTVAPPEGTTVECDPDNPDNLLVSDIPGVDGQPISVPDGSIVDYGGGRTATITLSDGERVSVLPGTEITDNGDGTIELVFNAFSVLGNGSVTNQTTHVRTVDITGNIPTTAHTLFADPQTGTIWRMLLPNTGNNEALIITEFVQDFSLDAPLSHQYNWHTWGHNGFTLYQESDAVTSVADWFNQTNVVGSDIRGRALNYEFQDNSGNTVAPTADGAGIEVAWPANTPSHLYRAGMEAATPGLRPNNSGRPALVVNPDAPTNLWANSTIANSYTCSAYAWPFTGCNQRQAMTRPAGGNGNAFLFSITEANTYFSGNAGDGGRQTQGHNNYNTDFNVSLRRWDLRSVGSMASNTIHQVAESGAFGGYAATNLSEAPTMRPGLWIAID